MAEVRHTVKTIIVRLMCDECGDNDNEMKPTGRCLISHPPQYQHECGNCGAVKFVRGETFPRTEYQEVCV